MIAANEKLRGPGPPEAVGRRSGVGGASPFRVLVCFKAVPDLDALTGSDWRPDDRFRIDDRFVKTIINTLDESALELSLKLRDQAEKMAGAAELTALTIGGSQADSILKTLYALKFNQAARIESPADLRFNPELTARLLADFISASDPFDLIVMGGRSADGDNARTPLLLAEILGRPCLTQVSGFKLQGDALEVTGATDDGELTRLVRPPVVLAVGNAPSTYLRIPTLKDRMTHGKKEISILTADAAATAGPAYELRSLKYEPHERDGVVIEGATAAEKARRLYDGYLKNRL